MFRMFIAPHSAFGKNAAHSHIGPWEWAAYFFLRRIPSKIIPAYPKWVMRTSQAKVTHTSTLETRKQIPDVHCAPLGIRKTPLIPITDHGNGRHC
jgi:hypothetical protein